MGTEVAWVPLAIAALGAGASYVNTEQTADRQDRAAAAAITSSAERQRKADQVVDQLIRQQTGSTPQDEIAAATDDYVAQLQRNRASGTRTSPGGAVFQSDQAAVQRGLGDYGDRIADLFARVQAPTLQRRNDAALFDTANQDIGLIKRGVAGDQFINNLKIKAITRNPLLDAFSSVAQGAAASDTDWGNLGSWGGV